MHIHLEQLEKRLQQLADSQAFHIKTGKRPIRVTFTRLQSQQTESDDLIIRLDARCSTYRGIAILYVRVRGMFEVNNSDISANCQIGFGLPTSLFEWVFGISWNLVLTLAGLTLILSASDLPASEQLLRYGFLPIVYGIYFLWLAHILKRAKESIPDIISSWCNI